MCEHPAGRPRGRLFLCAFSPWHAKRGMAAISNELTIRRHHALQPEFGSTHARPALRCGFVEVARPTRAVHRAQRLTTSVGYVSEAIGVHNALHTLHFC